MFAEIILPLNLPNSLTYGVPLELQSDIQVGMRVEVNLGKNKLYAGIVIQIHNQKPESFTVKPIKRILDNIPIVDASQIQFWKWISSYYLSSIGEVMNAALPSHFKLMSDTTLNWNPLLDQVPEGLSDNAFIVGEALSIRQKLTIGEIRLLLSNQNIAIVIDELLNSETAFIYDELEERYKPLTERFVFLNPSLDIV